jgi:hypothetical protein
MMPVAKTRTTLRPTAATIRSIIRRLDALEHCLRHRGTRGAKRSDFGRRWEILEEHSLRRQVARDEALRNENPALWRQLEISRRARNRETAALNRRLRADGLRPVELELSLAQRVKKLRQLEARNKAESAKQTMRS